MENKLRQGIKMVLVGPINLIINFAVFNILILIFGLNSGVLILIAFMAISYLFSLASSFILNEVSGDKLPHFIMVGAIELATTITVSYLAISMGLNALSAVPLYSMANAALIAGSVAVSFFNIFAYTMTILKTPSLAAGQKVLFNKKPKGYRLAI